MSNDLISRAWLKKHKFTTQVCNGLEIEYVDVVCVATIDNAPTVEQSYQMPKDYIKNKLDYSRPQGEWIIDGHHYKCSRCGKTLAIMFSETDDDDLIGCPFCLADMRVKGEKPQTIGCFNCKHDYKRVTEEPCKYCNDKFCKWQATDELGGE